MRRPWIWAEAALRASRTDGEAEKVPRAVLDRLTDLAGATHETFFMNKWV